MGATLIVASIASASSDSTTREEKAEAICTGAVGDDAYPRWEIDPSSQKCSSSTDGRCVIRLKKDHSVMVEHQCAVGTGGDDNEAAAPVSVYGGGGGGSRPIQEE